MNFRVVFGILFVIPILAANAFDTPGAHPFIENGFDTTFHVGDSAEITCTGPASVHGFFHFYESSNQFQTHSDRFGVYGALRIKVSNADTKFNQLVEMSGVLEGPSGDKILYFAMQDRGLSRIVFSWDPYEPGTINLPTSQIKGVQCEVKKVDPGVVHEIIGVLQWSNISTYKKELFFQAKDEIRGDARRFVVVGTDAAFDKVRGLVGKNIKIHGRVPPSGNLDIDAATVNASEIPALCNNKYSYDHILQREDWGITLGQIGTVTHRAGLYQFEKAIPYSSREEAQKWADYTCAWWSTYSTWSINSNFKCEADCK